MSACWKNNTPKLFHTFSYFKQTIKSHKRKGAANFCILK